MLIDVARYYIDLLVEIEKYKYEEKKDLRRSYRARLLERASFLKEAEKEIKEVEIVFIDALKEASTEEIEQLAKAMKNDEYLAELEDKREHTFVANAYLTQYKELNTYLKEQVLRYREGSKRKSLK